jgi:formylglycine-generating enzyme required for sulfatase activity
MAYAKYEGAKKKVEEIEATLTKALKTYQPTSKAVAKIRERLKRAQADLDKAGDDKKPADETMYNLLENQIQAKQTAYDELIRELLPSAPQSQALENEIHALRLRQTKLKFLLGGKSKPGEVMSNGIGMRLVWIPPGEFDMGTNDARSFERPVHRVRISKGFWMGQTEVTQGQYKAIMGADPWSGEHAVQQSDDNPAVYVSWEDALEFCKKLSQRDGMTYRLPTEAEWEYACRAGTKTAYSFGDSVSSLGDYAWFDGNTIVSQNFVQDYAHYFAHNFAHPVGQKKPNGFGLYDMHGNVWEWCADWDDKDYYSKSPGVDPTGPTSGDGHVLRGGSYTSGSSDIKGSLVALQSAFRWWGTPVSRNSNIGFRVIAPNL